MCANQIEDELQDLVISALDRVTSNLKATLQKIAADDQPPNTHLISFEYDSMSFVFEFPVSMTRFDRSDEEVDEICRLLPDHGPLFAKQWLLKNEYEEAGLEPIVIASKHFIHWFADCWHAAGGSRCPVPAYLSHHDSIHYYDLGTRETISPTDLGFDH